MVVDFSYTRESKSSVLPGFAAKWDEGGDSDKHLLILRNKPLSQAAAQILPQISDKVRFIDFDGLKSYATNVFQESAKRERSRAVTLVVEMIEQLIRAIAREGLSLSDVAWFDLERLFHRVLTGMGYLAHLTPSAGDGGRDVLGCEIQVDDVHWYAVEIKHWKGQKPGKREVGAFFDTTLREGRAGGLFLSTSGVSASAIALRTEVHEDRLRFADGDRLTQMCEHYVENDKGVWERHKTLRAFLFDGTE